jgi:hypothetical protein
VTTDNKTKTRTGSAPAEKRRKDKERSGTKWNGGGRRGVRGSRRSVGAGRRSSKCVSIFESLPLFLPVIHLRAVFGTGMRWIMGLEMKMKQTWSHGAQSGAGTGHCMWSCIHLSSRNVLNSYCMPGTVSGAADVAINKYTELSPL